MAKYVVLENNVVVSFAVADDPQVAADRGWVPYAAPAYLGGTYDPNTQTFTKAPWHSDNRPGPYYSWNDNIQDWEENLDLKNEDTRFGSFEQHPDLIEIIDNLKTRTAAEIVTWAQNNPAKANAVSLLLHAWNFRNR